MNLCNFSLKTVEKMTVLIDASTNREQVSHKRPNFACKPRHVSIRARKCSRLAFKRKRFTSETARPT